MTASTDQQAGSLRPPAAASWPLLFSAWLVATVSTLGALFLSEIMGVAPCVLCWYQRVFMFPLVFVLAAGLFPLDRRVLRYATPLVVAGGLAGCAVPCASDQRLHPREDDTLHAGHPMLAD